MGQETVEANVKEIHVDSGDSISTSSPSSHHGSIQPETHLNLHQFRCLMGIPQWSYDKKPREPKTEFDPNGEGLKTSAQLKDKVDRVRAGCNDELGIARPTIRTGQKWTGAAKKMLLMGRKSKPMDEEDQIDTHTSIYWSLRTEEAEQKSKYHTYNSIVYICLISQLVIASVLVIIGAIPNDGNPNAYNHHRISVAVLGAITGVLTGILSLLKGQGLPNRFLQYKARLRQVREKIEFHERMLRANCGFVVTYQDVLDMWQEYETVLRERDMNKQDAWATSNNTSADSMKKNVPQAANSGSNVEKK